MHRIVNAGLTVTR